MMGYRHCTPMWVWPQFGLTMPNQPLPCFDNDANVY
jgi:hypothetical protein